MQQRVSTLTENWANNRKEIFIQIPINCDLFALNAVSQFVARYKTSTEHDGTRR